MTPEQLTVVRNLIALDPALAAYPKSPDGADGIAKLLNAPANYLVWRTTTESADLVAALNWGAFLPVDTPDTNVAYLNRSTVCSLKQRGIVAILAHSPVRTGSASVRQSFADCVTGIPSGAGGAVRDAGVAALVAVARRPATRLEAEFAVNGLGTAAQPSTLTFEGSISLSDVEQALRS